MQAASSELSKLAATTRRIVTRYHPLLVKLHWLLAALSE
jgi:hypothetical protein